MARLSARQITLGLKALPDWSARGGEIRRRYEFKGFLGAIDFVNRVAARAERADHHPDIDIRWNKVTLTLSTHSEGGLTAKDFSMARQCDRAFSGLAGK
ncbi:MAG TPA: 4a-hydroxytetrahydrobiopterin dehydratase [Opitutaceae bacterium]